METGMADTLNDISACPMAMTIIGSQEWRTAACALDGETVCVAIPFSPPDCVRWDHGLVPPPAHASGCETSRSRPSRCDRNLATNCPLTLLPALSSGGANVPSPPLPGDTVTIPPPMPLLPGSPMSYSQSPEVS